jgi:hypothetical protein
LKRAIADDLDTRAYIGSSLAIFMRCIGFHGHRMRTRAVPCPAGYFRVVVSADDRARLTAIIEEAAEACSAWRDYSVFGGSAARSASGVPHRREPARGVAVAAPLCETGVEGLLRDNTWPPGADRMVKLLALTCAKRPARRPTRLAARWQGVIREERPSC